MKNISVYLLAFVSTFTISCQAKPVENPNALPKDESSVKLANRFRELVTDPEIVKLESSARYAAVSVRRTRQIEIAKPIMLQLILIGKAGYDPLSKLVNDENENVRRICVILLGGVRTNEKGLPLESQILTNINIPLLEQALSSKDPEVRYFAANGLGDFADFSDECLARVQSSLPRLRELRNDTDPEVQSLVNVAYSKILAMQSIRAKKPEQRKAASEELEKINQKKSDKNDQ